MSVAWVMTRQLCRISVFLVFLKFFIYCSASQNSSMVCILLPLLDTDMRIKQCYLTRVLNDFVVSVREY